MAVVADEFNVRRLAVVGGGHIDGSMLEAGLIDEVSLLIGAGVDGRAGQTAVFDGLTKSDQPISLHLKSVRQFDSDAVWLKYSVD